MIPKVEGPWDIHYVDRLLAQLEAKAGLERPILIHAILETAQGVANLEEIACAVAAHPGHELRPRRPRGLAAHEDHARRRRAPRLPHDRRPRPGEPRGAASELPAGPVALLDRAHGRRVHVRRRAALLRPLRRHQGRRGLRDAVPRLVPARLRRRLVAASGADRDRQEGLLPRPRRGRVREKGDRGDPRRARRAHDRRQDAGRRHLEAVQGDGQPRRNARQKDPELAEAYGLSACGQRAEDISPECSRRWHARRCWRSEPAGQPRRWVPNPP